MFFMATGCRAIRDPLKHEDEFISPGGHGALGDKGSDDGHMSRLVVLTDLLKRQLKAYKAHCRAITGQLELHAPAPTNGFFLRLTDDSCLSYEEIRPLHIKAVMRQIEGFTPHAVNAFRKFLRYLLELLPADICSKSSCPLVATHAGARLDSSQQPPGCGG